MCKTIGLLCMSLLLLLISDHQMNGLEVKCEGKMQKMFDFFAFFKNPDGLPPSSNRLTGDTPFPTNVCFIMIDLQENETLTFSNPSNNQITSLMLVARPPGSTLSEFPVEIFITFPNLAEASLILAGLEHLKEDDFVNAINLRQLHLEGNNIRLLGSTAFQNLKNLTTLTLQTNQIREIEDFTFANLNQLEGLYLQFNNLTSLKENVFSGLTNLRRLSLENNQIATIEDGALYLENLEELYLLGNRLKELSPDLLTVTPVLRNINVSNNKLVSIGGGTFGKSSSLYSIVLSDNQIHSVDWIEFASIPSLRILSLENNSLKMEPLTMEAEDDAVYKKNLANAMNKTKLEYLNLGDNKLSRSDILQQLTALRNLLYLNLDNNPIVTIDDVKTIRENFPKLIHISLLNATLSCEWLEETVSFIQKSKVKLVTDYIFSQPEGQLKEIDGMVCVPPKN